MSILGIQGQLLEVSVIECHKLKDTEWISRQDPYVCLEYGSAKFRTRTCTDGGKNPVFQEKFVFNLIEGLREINVAVWNSNTITHDDFIGSGKVQLHDVLSRGYDDRAWSLQTKTGRYAGEIKLIMHYAYANAKANRPATSITISAAPQLHQPIYSNPPVSSMTHSYQTPAYALAPSTAYPPPSAYPPPPQPYPASSPYPAPYPSLSYPPPAAHSPYPPPTAHSPHPPATYPPPPAAYPPESYPPPPQGSPYFRSGYYPGVYPPQRY